jgi:hypothetical protein
MWELALGRSVVPEVAENRLPNRIRSRLSCKAWRSSACALKLTARAGVLDSGFTAETGHDVRGPRQRRIGNARHRTMVAPIFEPRLAKDILADALDKALGLCRARPPCRRMRKACSGASGRLTPSWYGRRDAALRGRPGRERLGGQAAGVSLPRPVPLGRPDPKPPIIGRPSARTSINIVLSSRTRSYEKATGGSV